MHSSLRLVNERFARVREEATRLFERDPNFRDVCEEYETCARTLDRLRSGAAASQRMRDEYGALLLRVEHELLRYLEERADRREP